MKLNMLLAWAFHASLLNGLSAPLRAESLTRWERALPDEQKQAEALSDLLISQIKSEYTQKAKRAFRDAHPRGIGCVAARFTVNSDLKPELRTGVLSQPGRSYEALIRFSSALGPQGDQEPDARGMAIKLLGVEGPKLLASQSEARTHDFLMIDAPTFPVRDAPDFAGIVTIKSEPSHIFSYLWDSPFRRALQLKALRDMTKGNPNHGKSLLERRYFSMVPYLFKSAEIESPVKFSARPCASLAPRPLDGSAAELRQDLAQRLSQGAACFDFAFQFYRDGLGIDIEDGRSEWPEDELPFVSVAQIEIASQSFLSDARLAYCDALSFHPWHALAAHRPLGGINRTRKIVYEKISRFRHAANREEALLQEPSDLKAWQQLPLEPYDAWRGLTVPASRP